MGKTAELAEVAHAISIGNTGNVLIGASDNATDKLQIAGTVSVDVNGFRSNAATGAGYGRVKAAFSAGGLSLLASNGSDVATMTDLDAPDVSTTSHNVRLWRGTNTTALCSFILYAADGAGTTRHRFNSDGTASLAQNGATVTFGGGATFAGNLSAANLSSGTYTPSVTMVANLSANTPYTCQWSRVGDVVTVSGLISLTCTASSTNTLLRITLPVASNLTSVTQCAGSGGLGNATGNENVVIYGSAATDEAIFRFQSDSTAARDCYFIFSYRVL